MRNRLTFTMPLLVCLGLVQGGCGLLGGLFPGLVPGPNPSPVNPPIPVPTPGPNFPIREARDQLGQLLETAPVRRLFEPGTLVHEGVGIFSLGDAPLPDLPARWGRSYPRGIQVQAPVIDRMSVEFFQTRADLVTAEATFSVERGGTLLADYPLQRRLVRKPFRDLATRQARFGRGPSGWSLTEVSPFSLRTVPGGIGVASFSVVPRGGVAYSGAPDRTAPLSAYPRVETGQTLEVTLQLDTGTPAAGCHVFVTFPPLRDRILLAEAGTDGLPGLYRGSFEVPSPLPASPQLVLDVMTVKTLTDPESLECDSLLIGIPVDLVPPGGPR